MPQQEQASREFQGSDLSLFLYVWNTFDF
jgi:hypothetical protein